MKREEKLMHDDGSITIEGDGAGEYLQHDFDHRKGKGNDEEHCDAYGHEEMHSIPHNESPIRSNVLDDVKDAWNKRAKGAKPLSSIPEKNVPEPMGHPTEPKGPHGGHTMRRTYPKAEDTRPM